MNLSKVSLFTRPRRFGKSLNMNMLKSFFEVGCDLSLFEGLAIAKEEKICEEYMGKFPVISISLKDVNGLNFESACASMCMLIGMEAMRFDFLAHSESLGDVQRRLYQSLVHVNLDGSFEMPQNVLESSLRTLSLLLEQHYGQKVILLIDEYDVPLDKASEHGYYEEMVNLLRNMFSIALKSNDSLQFAVMTGCLRISKESIFTGLNNLRVVSMTSVGFHEYFGFTDQEVRDILRYYGFMDCYEAVKTWYDGYLWGGEEIYCPWDVINYCAELRMLRRFQPGASMEPKNYWVNTSENGIIRRLLHHAKGQTRADIEELVAGGILKKWIEENFTYKELYQNDDYLWSAMFATGYLTSTGVDEQGNYHLKIPNLEVRSIFVYQIMRWFEETVQAEPSRLDAFCKVVADGEAEQVQALLTAYLKKTISIRDTFTSKVKKENFYHGILLGLLSHHEEWVIRSNAEAGDGYSDIQIWDEETDTGIVIEIKYAEDGKLDACCKAGLRQIEEKSYADALEEDGMTRIIRYGIAFYKKRCEVQCQF